MKRNHLYALMLFLLALLPAGLLAQSVTGMEYWFDKLNPNEGNKVWTSISEGGNTKSISTDGLSVGMHTLYYRFTQSGGDVIWEGDKTDVETGEVTHERIYYADLEHSPVYSTRFFKHDTSQGSTVEYWFDNKSSHATTSLSCAEGETVTLDLTDISRFPLGFHQLHMRFSTPGKSPSAIYTADVMKFSAGSRYLQYWVDGNYSPESPKVEGAVMTAHLDDGKTRDDVIFNLSQVALTDVAPGLHHLYFRTCDANGVAGSAVYSTIIFRHASEANQIEYWFDDDASTIQRETFAEANQNGATYTINLNKDVFPQGLHQLNIRVSTKNGSKSAIYSTPVIKMSTGGFNTLQCWLDDDMGHIQTIDGAKGSNVVVFNNSLDFGDVAPGMHYLHYRTIGNDGKPSNAVGEWPILVKSRYNRDPSEVKITGYSFWVDNQVREEFEMINPTKGTTIHHQIDTRKLSKGNHTLHTKIWNDSGAALTEENAFVVGDADAPSIAMTAQVKDGGVVELVSTAVANDVSYDFWRKDTGEPVKIFFRGPCYPYTVDYTDKSIPESGGTYTYYIEAKYRDSDNQTMPLKSNEVTVTVPAIPKEEKPEYGYLTGDVTCDKGALLYSNMKVKCKFLNSDTPDRYQQLRDYGSFYIDNIPVNSNVELSIIGDTRHDYDTWTGVIQKGKNKVDFDGRSNTSDDTFSYEYDLYTSAAFTWGSTIDFEVMSASPTHTWKGKIFVYAVKKSKAKDLNEEQIENPSVLKSEYTFTNEITVKDKSVKISIPLNFLGKLWKDTEYYFFFKTKGNKDGQPEVMKPLAIKPEFCETDRYVLHKVDKNYSDQVTENISDEDAKRLASLLVRLCSKVKGLNGKVGDMDRCAEEVTKSIKSASYSSHTRTEDEEFEWMMDKIRNRSVYEFFSDPTLKPFLTNVDYATSLIAAFDTDLLTFCKSVQGFTSALTLISDLNQYVNGENHYDKFFSCAHAIFYSVSKFSNDPIISSIASILCTYVDIGDAFAQAASGFGDAIFEANELRYWAENREFAREDQYNTHIDFKIKIKAKKKWMNFSNYSENDFSKMIDYVKVHFTSYLKGTGEITGQYAANFKLVGINDGIMLKQIGNLEPNNSVPSTDHSLHRMWMEIKWANGRTSLIPLIKKNDYGVEYRKAANNVSTYLHTVKFASSSSDPVHIADDIHLKD